MKFMDKLKFGNPKYQAPQLAAVPERRPEDQTGTYINESRREIVVKIFDTGHPDDLAKALGAIEIAKDVVKQTLSVWHAKDAQRKSVILPVRPNGGLHVQ